MKKILVVARTLELGGVSEMLIKYCRSVMKLAKDGVSFDFAAGYPIEERYKKAISGMGGRLFVTDKIRRPVGYVARIRSIVKEGRYDIIHIHGSSNLIAPDLAGARLGGAKRLIAHSHNTSCAHLRLSRMVRPFFGALYTDALACSKEAGEWMFGGRPFTVMENGIDLDAFRFNEGTRNAMRSVLDIADKFVVGHVGNFNYQKNHAILIRSFAEFLKNNPESRLLLVGDGPTKETMVNLAHDIGIGDKVIFYGVSDDVPSLLMAMDVFALPSRFEGLPLVLVEAQASGLPCVVSDRVSSETRMSEAYISADIEGGTGAWRDAISVAALYSGRKELCAANMENLKNAGYDIDEAGRKLLAIYGIEETEGSIS